MNAKKAEAARVFIGLGANRGDSEANIRRALQFLGSRAEIEIVAVSSLRETAPVGVTDQPFFLNGAAEIKTTLPPLELLGLLKDIEKQVGRIAGERWGPREIDLDLLYYGKEVIDTAELTVPHKELAKRRFVLVPLNEIAPDFRHPLSGLSNAELFGKCQGVNE